MNVCVRTGRGTAQYGLHDGRGAASSISMRVIYTSQPQAVDFYTADLYLILLSDNNDNSSKHNKRIVTDYSFNDIVLVRKKK